MCWFVMVGTLWVDHVLNPLTSVDLIWDHVVVHGSRRFSVLNDILNALGTFRLCVCFSIFN